MPEHTHPTLRLGLVPVSLLVFYMSQGHPLAMLPPVFTVLLLMISPTRPPGAVLLKLWLVVTGVSILLALYAMATVHWPVIFWLGIAAILSYGFARLARSASDFVGLVVLIITAMITILVHRGATTPLAVPALMSSSFLVAIGCCYLAYALWPGPMTLKPLLLGEPDRPSALSVAAKVAAMLVALGAAIMASDNSALFIASTIASLLQDPQPQINSRGRMMLRGNILGAMVALPGLAMTMFDLHPAVLLPTYLAAGLWLADRWRIMATEELQTAMIVFLVLLSSPLTNVSGSVTTVISDRLLTLVITIAYCALMLRLLHPPRREDVLRGIVQYEHHRPALASGTPKGG